MKYGCAQSFLVTLAVSLPIILTGCPMGDRFKIDETAQVAREGKSICFSVEAASDYQPTEISISRRGANLSERKFIIQPDLSVIDGKLCIPPSFYQFQDDGRFIINYVLVSSVNNKSPRRVVVGIELISGEVKRIALMQTETSWKDGSF